MSKIRKILVWRAPTQMTKIFGNRKHDWIPSSYYYYYCYCYYYYYYQATVP